MDDLVVAADEGTTSSLVNTAQSLLGTQSASGTDTLGPFDVNWNASAAFQGGSVDLREPDIIRLENIDLNFTVGIGLSIDLSDILPDFCLPQVCITIPFIGRVCTPSICVDWPTIPIGPISHSGTVSVTSDFRVTATPDGSNWKIEIEIVDVPSLSLDAISALIVTALIGAVAAALLLVPFIGPFLALATAAIGAAIGIAAVTGLLGPILSLFLAGLKFKIYDQPRLQTLIPAAGTIDPAVRINIDSLQAVVESTDEDELVLTANISPEFLPA